MASSRTINYPGIELKEFDMSAPNMLADYSLPNAPTALFIGFSDIGEDYAINWINQRETFHTLYGRPKTTFEKYLYNGVMSFLNRGGMAITAKLPYYNASKDAFTYTTYKVAGTVNSTNYSNSQNPLSDLADVYTALNTTDSNINSFLVIEPDSKDSGKLGIEDIDGYLTGDKAPTLNTIKIVNTSKTRYQKTAFDTVKTQLSDDAVLSGEDAEIQSNDCLGIIPVIVSPTVAMYYQNLIQLNELSLDNEQYLKVAQEFGLVSSFAPVTPDGGIFYDISRITVDMSELSNNLVIPMTDVINSIGDDGEDTLTVTEPLNANSITKRVSDYFPEITYKSIDHFDPTNLKNIGVVVLSAFTDKDNNNMVNFTALESFVGSLDKTATNPADNSTLFIDTIINNSSNYIRFFSNINKTLLDANYTIHCKNGIATSLGFYDLDCEKTIDYNKSISQPLTYILDSIQDPNVLNIDLIVDCGLTNIAQYTVWDKSIKKHNVWTIETQNDVGAWKAIVQKIDNFCKLTRKDCMFIVDAPKPLCLEGEQKIVRRTKPENTVSKNIIPKLRLLTGINSSYSAGYCNWFYCQDAYTGDLFWCPPSIKVAPVYCYCNTYFMPWSAPAGMTRGVISDAIDIAFNPNQDESGKIYSQNWNYAVSYPLDGIIVEGQKTFQTNNTALTRVSIRRLMLYLEKAVSRTAKYFKYEGNTAYMRQRFVDTIRPVFERAVTRGGVNEYLIVCDETNNPTTVVEDNTMVCTIAVRPVKTIEYIVLSFSITNQSASLVEAVSRV